VEDSFLSCVSKLLLLNLGSRGFDFCASATPFLRVEQNLGITKLWV